LKLGKILFFPELDKAKLFDIIPPEFQKRAKRPKQRFLERRNAMDKFEKGWLGLLTCGLVIAIFWMLNLGITLGFPITLAMVGMMVLLFLAKIKAATNKSDGRYVGWLCVLYCIFVLMAFMAPSTIKRYNYYAPKEARSNLTPIQEQFISQSTMTAHSINNTYSVLSVGKELAPGLHEVKVATGSGKNERMVIFSALYFGEVKGGEEVDLIRIEQSGSDPYEKLNGQRSSFILASPRVVKVDLKNDPYPGMQREEVGR